MKIPNRKLAEEVTMKSLTASHESVEFLNRIDKVYKENQKLRVQTIELKKFRNDLAHNLLNLKQNQNAKKKLGFTFPNITPSKHRIIIEAQFRQDHCT